MVYDGEQLTNPNLIEYRVPRLRDTPRRITSVLAERGDGAGPYGAKGAGEGSPSTRFRPQWPPRSAEPWASGPPSCP